MKEAEREGREGSSDEDRSEADYSKEDTSDDPVWLINPQFGAPQRPHHLLPVPNVTPRHYSIIGSGRKGLTFYLRHCHWQNIAFNCCPGFPAAV